MAAYVFYLCLVSDRARALLVTQLVWHQLTNRRLVKKKHPKMTDFARISITFTSPHQNNAIKLPPSCSKTERPSLLAGDADSHHRDIDWPKINTFKALFLCDRTAAFNEKSVLMPTIPAKPAVLSTQPFLCSHNSGTSSTLQCSHFIQKLNAVNIAIFHLDTLDRSRESQTRQFLVKSTFPVLKLQTPHQHSESKAKELVF